MLFSYYRWDCKIFADQSDCEQNTQRLATMYSVSSNFKIKTSALLEAQNMLKDLKKHFQNTLQNMRERKLKTVVIHHDLVPFYVKKRRRKKRFKRYDEKAYNVNIPFWNSERICTRNCVIWGEIHHRSCTSAASIASFFEAIHFKEDRFSILANF